MNKLREIIGFIYGWIFYACHLIPLDIEITLGLSLEGEFVINVFDFGKTIKCDRLGDITVLCEKMLREISDDEYIDILGDSCAMKGFETARKEASLLY
jgi:hypothetical protein